MNDYENLKRFRENIFFQLFAFGLANKIWQLVLVLEEPRSVGIDLPLSSNQNSFIYFQHKSMSSRHHECFLIYKKLILPRVFVLSLACPISSSISSRSCFFDMDLLFFIKMYIKNYRLKFYEQSLQRDCSPILNI